MAIRAAGSTNWRLDLSVVARTNWMIDRLAGPSFHDGSGSDCALASEVNPSRMVLKSKLRAISRRVRLTIRPLPAVS